MGRATGRRPPPLRSPPGPPQKRLESALVLVQRAAEGGAAQLAELLRRAAVLGLLLPSARVRLLDELHQRLGQVHLRGLFQLYRDERRHGEHLGRRSGQRAQDRDESRLARTTRLADRGADGRVLRRCFGSGHFRELPRRRTGRAACSHVKRTGVAGALLLGPLSFGLRGKKLTLFGKGILPFQLAVAARGPSAFTYK